VVLNLNVGLIGKEGDPFAIGRRVRKPVARVIVIGDLNGIGAISVNAPDLHVTAAHGIEIDIFAVRRIVRRAIKTRHIGEAHLGPVCE
jgi:hypothetical protein